MEKGDVKLKPRRQAPNHQSAQEWNVEPRQPFLRSAAALFAILSISGFVSVIPRWNSTFRHNSGPATGDWTDGMPLGPVSHGLTLASQLLTAVPADFRPLVRRLLYPAPSGTDSGN